MSYEHTAKYFYGFCVGADALEDYCKNKRDFKKYCENNSLEIDSLNREDYIDWIERKHAVKVRLCGDFVGDDEIFYAVYWGKYTSLSSTGWCGCDNFGVTLTDKGRLKRFAKKFNCVPGPHLTMTHS